MSLIDDSSFFHQLPDGLKRSLTPIENTTGEGKDLLSYFLPAWGLQGGQAAISILTGGNDFGMGDSTEKYITAAMTTLRSNNPDAYEDEFGMLTSAGSVRLMKDAEKFARGFGLGKALLMTVHPGQIVPDLTMQVEMQKDMSVKDISQASLLREYYDLHTRLGSREEALLAITDKYGVDAVVGLASRQAYRITPTSDALDAIMKNPKLADAAPTVASLFYPGGGYSPDMERFGNKALGDRKLTPQERLASSNKVLYDAQRARIDQIWNNSDHTPEDKAEWKANKAALSRAYSKHPSPELNTAGTKVAMEDIRVALAEAPELVSTEAGRAAIRYLQLRDSVMPYAEGGSIGGQDDLELRLILKEELQELVQQFPEFWTMADRVFMSELRVPDDEEVNRNALGVPNIEVPEPTISDMNAAVVDPLQGPVGAGVQTPSQMAPATSRMSGN